MKVNGETFVEILDSEWSHDSGRYIATLNIAGLLMHVEAFPSFTDAEGFQSFGDFDEALMYVYQAMGGDGAWETTQVCGVECVIVATPFCH